MCSGLHGGDDPGKIQNQNMLVRRGPQDTGEGDHPKQKRRRHPGTRTISNRYHGDGDKRIEFCL